MEDDVDKLTDEQLDALARHAEWGHLEGQDYEAIPGLVDEIKQLRGDLAGAEGGRDGWQSRALLAESDRDRAMQVVADAAFVMDLEEGDTVSERLRWLIREHDSYKDGSWEHKNREDKPWCDRRDSDDELWSLLDAR